MPRPVDIGAGYWYTAAPARAGGNGRNRLACNLLRMFCMPMKGITRDRFLDIFPDLLQKDPQAVVFSGHSPYLVTRSPSGGDTFTACPSLFL
jgi:hypothetical protein